MPFCEAHQREKGKQEDISEAHKTQKSICESGVNIENNLLKCRKNISCLQCNTDLKLELKGMKPRGNKQA